MTVSGTHEDGFEPANERYLAASLVWLRLLLMRAAATTQPGSPPAPVAAVATTGPIDPATHHRHTPPARWPWRRRRTAAPEPATPGTPGTSTAGAPQTPRKALPQLAGVTDEEIAAAADERAAAAVAGVRPALVELAERLSLSAFERDVLLLCVAIELDTSIAGLCARAQGAGLDYPTFALALSVLPEPTWDALSPMRGLRQGRLIEVRQASGEALTASPLQADERAVNYVKGLNVLDERIDRLVTHLAPPAPHVPFPPSQAALVAEIVRQWHEGSPDAPLPVVQLLGPDARLKQELAARAVAELGRGLLRVTASTLPTDGDELEALARVWQRESQLLPIALYLDAEESEPATDADRALRRLLARSDGVLLLGTRDLRQDIDRPAFAVDVTRPTRAEQREVWTQSLGAPATTDTVDALAGQFDLAPSVIAELSARALADDDPDTLRARLWTACVASSRSRLDALAQRLEPRAHWKDLVLPPDELALLHEIAAQVGQRSRVYEDWGFADQMTRGLGISVLFAGPSGTGKTLAAEVLANELGLGLYRIDLSAVVSKYIGETEKNLRRMFDAAEEGAAVLFFDEADALFGKRSEVKDSHDRYANIEINYLLQRMEGYRGLAILATNMKRSLDQAFMRRLRFIIDFPFPALAQRRELWSAIFPPDTPTEELELDRLARLPATGGMVRNIALNAAFAAADSGQPVTMPIVLNAARTEFRKLELPVPEREFASPAPKAAP
jgi:hypothetical protein